MATIAQSVPSSVSPLAWFGEFLKQELAPYPGRILLVARMVIAATLVMIICMTFRIPNAAWGAIYALTISREGPQATVRAASSIGGALLISAADVLIGALFFLDDPTLRFLWVIGTLFAVFYAISAMTNYAAAARFGYLVAVTIPLWDSHISGEAKVEGTLWGLWVMILASAITVLVELAFAELVPSHDVVRRIAERLACVEELLTSYATGTPLTGATKEKIANLSMLGTSSLRRTLQRSTYSRHYREQMGAAVGLVTRLIDIAANLTYENIEFSDSDRTRIHVLVDSIAAIRVDLLTGRVPTQIHVDSRLASHAVPLLGELERAVQMIPEIFAGSQSLSAYGPPPAGGEARTPVFVPDALSNSEHAKFALRGCLAASLCYLIYNSLDWPGISTAVTTCVLTALTTIGASHQRQILRFVGTLIGGVGIGMGAQVFILPHLDSIAGFTVLFVAVTALTAWVAASSPRLSYLGVQLAAGFYLLHLQEFKIQTSLAVARDRVVGLLLGLFIMWLVFDQLWWSAPAAVQMKRTFISTLRSLAQFAREPVSKDTRVATDRSLSLRETINKNFDKVRSLGDAVLFEFGPSRHQDLASRERIRQWQPRLRVLFLTRIALLKYRLKFPGFELPPSVASAQEQFDDELAQTLDAMANRLEGKTGERKQAFEDSFKHLEDTIEAQRAEELDPALAAELQTFATLSRRIETLATSLDQEI